MAYLGNRPVSGDNNSFRVLDDIKTHTFSFDGSSSSVVSTSDNTITHLGHRLIQGQRVTYTDGTGSPIGGLTDGTVYFVVINDANSFKLASSASNAAAGTGINLTSVGSGTAHNITVAFDGVNTKFKATFNNGTEADVTRVAQIQISLNNVIQQPQNTATPTSGFGFDSDSVIVFATAPASNATFWGVLFANNFPTFEISDNDVDNFTGDGSKTEFSLSKSPATNENIIVTIDGVVQYPSDNSTTRAYNTVGNALQFSAAPADGADIQARHIGFAGPDPSVAGVTAFYGRTGSVFLNNSDNIVVNDAEVTGNLTVQGSMTTLDTKVTEVDQLEVAANNTTVGVAITQSGSGDILNLYDGSTEVFSVEDGGSVRVGDNASYSASTNADDLVIGATTGQHGITILTGNNSSNINFADSAAVNPGAITYNHNGTQYMRFRVAGGEKLRIQSGNVGINSTAPTSRLDVVGDAKITGIVTAASFVGGLPITNGADNRVITATSASAIQGEAGLTFDGSTLLNSGSGFKGITIAPNTNNSATLRLQNSVKNFSVSNVTGGKFAIADGSDQRFIIDGSGNVGVGTNTPDTKLEVFGGNTSIQVGNQSGLGRFGADGTSTKIGSHSNHHLDLFTNGSSNTRLRIKNDGNVIIGTTTWLYEKPLNVQGSSGSILSLYNGDTTSYAANTFSGIELKLNTGNTGNTFGACEIRGIKEEGTNGNNARALTFYTGINGGGNIEKLRITSDGEVRIANGGLLTIKTDAVATYGVSEALRIDDSNGVNDRALQIFEYQNSGARWFSFNQNLNVTTTGTSYTYTQGNYGGSNMIEMNSGDLRIYSDPQIVGGGTSAITPTQRVSILNNGNIGIGTNFPTQKLEVKYGEAWIDNNSGDNQARSDGLTVSHTPNANFTVASDPTDARRTATFAVKGASRASVVTLRNIDDDSAFWDFIADGNTNKFYIQRGGGGAALGSAVTIDTNLNVGIGSDSTGGARLRVFDNGTNTLIQQWRTYLGSTAGERPLNLYSPATDSFSDYFRFQTGNAIKFQIDSIDALCIEDGGNIGIGTDDPQTLLHLKSDDPTLRIQRYNQSAYGDITADTAGKIIFKSDPGGAASGDGFSFTVDNSEKVRITSAGNVGIGTTDPTGAQKLHVYADSTGTGGIVQVTQSGSGDAAIDFQIKGAREYSLGIDNSDSDKFKLSSTAGLDSDTILTATTDGKVGIGSDSPTQALDVNGKIKVFGSDGSAYGLVISPDSSGGTYEHLIAKSNGDLRLQAGSGTYQASNANILLKNNKNIIINAGNNGNVGIGSIPDERLHVVVTSATATAAKFERSHNNNVSIEYRNTTSRMFAGLAGDALGFAIDDDANLGVGPMFMVRRTTGKVGIGSDNPHRTLVLETGDGDIHCFDGNGGIYMGADNSGGFQKNCAIARAGANNFHIGGSEAGDLCIASESGASMIFGVSPFAGGMDTFLHVSRLRNFNLYGTDYKFHIGSTERFNIKNNGNIGIGTIDATSKVHIGPLNGDTSHHVYLSSGNNDYGFLIDVQDYGSQNVPLRIFNRRNNNDTEVVRITQDGDVGIGTNNPITKLHVESATGTATYATISQQKTYGSGTGTAERSGLNLAIREANTPANNRIFGRIEVGTNSETDSSHGFMSFFTRQSATISEKLRITSTGNVGINETSPASTLVVRKDNQGGRGGELSIVNFAGGGSNGIGNEAALNFGLENSTYDADSGNAQIKAVTTAATNGTDIVISNWSGSSFEERLRITRAGNVGIGIANPDELLHIFSASGNSKIVLEADNNSANNGIYWVDEGDSTQSEFYYSHPDNKQFLKLNGNGFEIYSKQTSKVTAKIGHSLGYNDVVVPNGKLGVGTDNAGTTLDVFGFLQVKDSTGKLSMQVDGANGVFKVFQSPAGWNQLTYNPSPILAWDYKNGPGDLFYIGSGGNTAMASQMALVVSDGHGVKIGKSGYDGSDFDISSSDEFFRVDTSGNLTLTGKTGNSSPRFTIRHNNADVEGEVIRLARTELPGIRYHSIKARHSGNSSLNYISVNVHDGGGSPYTGQAEVARFLGSGKVGIGTDIPSDGAKLEVFARGDTERGIFITDSNTTHNSPYLRVLGKRGDGNTHQSFSGRILLASLRTNDKINSGRKVGVIMFGGNHTNTSESNILYPASIAGVAGDSFDSATDMPTDLAFYTGNTGRAPNTNNVSSGEERLRIKSTGVVTMPYQVAFFAHCNIGNHDLDPGDKFEFNVLTSSGKASVNSNHTTFGGTNVFNTSTNTFTAPVAGLYQFTVTAYYRRTGDPLGPLMPRVNNVEVSNGNNGIFFFANSNPTDGDTMSGTLYLQLAANDAVTVHRRNHGSGTVRFYGPHSHFCGHLIG